MISKRRNVFKLLLCVIIVVILMGFCIFLNYKNNFTTHGIDYTINQISKPMIDNIIIHYLNVSKNESYFNESTLLNDRIEWNFHQPTIIIIGGHCSATSSMCAAINKFNYFVHSGCDHKYFTTCTPQVEKK